MDVHHVWGHNSETKGQIKNPKTCGPSKWPPPTKGMPYSWVRNVSIEKPRDNRKTGYRNIILEIYQLTFLFTSHLFLYDSTSAEAMLTLCSKVSTNSFFLRRLSWAEIWRKQNNLNTYMYTRHFDTKNIARSHRSSSTGCYCELHTKISSCYNEPRSCLNLIF